MILRRPYAFLVKHFRLIHIILLAFMAYVFVACQGILDFLNEYIGAATPYFDYETVSSTIGGFVPAFLTVLLMMVAGILIYLLRYKRKPILFYIVILSVYTIILFEFIIMPSFVYSMGYTVPSGAFIRIIRDVLMVISIVQIGFMVLTFIRAIGFDIKKFDFKKDVQDLGIDEDDNEEFEFELNIDKDAIFTNIKKRLRYLKYFYKEYKFFFYVGYAIAAVVLVFSIVSFISSLEHVYKQNETYDLNGLKYTVLESYNTVLNSKGNRINDKYFYTIVKIKVTNHTGGQKALNTKNIFLYYNGTNSVNPNTLVYDNFKEYGIQYYNQILSPNQTRTFILIFQSPIEYYSRVLKMKTVNYVEYKEGKVVFNYRTVRLSPIYDSNKTKTVREVRIKEDLSFKESLLGNTVLNISKVDLSDIFSYNVKHCKGSICNTESRFVSAPNYSNVSLTVMRIQYSLKLDYEKLGKGYTSNDFLARYGKIRYYISGIKNDQALYHNIVIKDLTPVNTNKISFIEVKSILERATKVYIDFSIKDKVYSYLIIDNTNKEKTTSVDLPG